jgi:hypothetical protein
MCAYVYCQVFRFLFTVNIIGLDILLRSSVTLCMVVYATLPYNIINCKFDSDSLNSVKLVIDVVYFSATILLYH